MALSPEQVHDLAVQHRIGLSRYSTSVVRKVVALLNRTEQSVTDRLARTGNETIAGQRLQQLLADVQAIQTQGQALITARVNAEAASLAVSEVDFTAGLLETPTSHIAGTFSPLPTETQIIAAVNARPFQGKFLQGWLDEVQAAAAKNVRDAIRQGFVEGRTTAEVVQTIRGTKAANYKNGLMEASRRHVETMVRTAMTHTANVAAQATYQALDVSQWRFVATLDARTSLICMGLHGKLFDVGTGPQPPRHPNCRSTSVPMVDPIPGVKPFEFPTYNDWLRKQPAKVQDDILGAAKAAMFRQGKLPVDRFTDSAGKTLTLDQLKKRDADAFTAAGLDLPIKPPRGLPQEDIAKFLADPVAQRSLLDRLYGSAADTDRAFARVQTVAKAAGWDAETQDLAAIRYYTGNGYGPINARMRDSGGTLEDRQFSALASRGIDALPDETGPVWRAPLTQKAAADRWWDQATVGQPMDIGHQLLSFSRSEDISANWSRDTLLLLKVADPKHGSYVEQISQNPGEEEVLFPLGLKYRVAAKSEQTVGGRPFRVIELEVVE